MTISGFKIKALDYSDVTGIHMTACSDCNISNNDLSENYLGLSLSSSEKNTISNNSMNLNEKYGIHIINSENNIFVNNTANSNAYGIVLESNSSDNNLTGNLANSNRGYGFYIISSGNNTFNNNTAVENSLGMYLVSSNMSTISGSNVSENLNYALWISRSNYNIISENTANKTSFGIHLDASDNNKLYGNIIASNADIGLSLCPACDNNTVFNNYFKNVYNADAGNRRNYWNIKRTEGENIVGGPYIAGNFWASPDGTGFSETAPDKDKNGIADIAYNETDITDYLPLVSAPNPEQEVTPLKSPITASIESNVSIESNNSTSE